AVAGMTKVAAAEAAAKGVRVNALGPGATMTAALRGWKESSPEAFQAVADSIPMRRVSEPEEQAEPAVFLCSDAASYITGVTLFVDGGNGILGR
ncbi:MAG TPA: SDR family oxidoreductase, partial [Aeromicrobium sp.]|nr:SDR family oxidoreductase [Aeromicrobium sp.]